MSKRKGRTITLDDPSGLRLDAVWSRSGARLGLSIMKLNPPGQDYVQIELRPEQVEALGDFLVETASKPPADRLAAN
jgi:hypothetical protein